MLSSLRGFDWQSRVSICFEVMDFTFDCIELIEEVLLGILEHQLLVPGVQHLLLGCLDSIHHPAQPQHQSICVYWLPTLLQESICRVHHRPVCPRQKIQELHTIHHVRICRHGERITSFASTRQCKLQLCQQEC